MATKKPTSKKIVKKSIVNKGKPVVNSVVKTTTKSKVKPVMKKVVSHPVDEKLNDAMDNNLSNSNSVKYEPNSTKTTKSSPIAWIILSVILLGILGMIFMYEYNPSFRAKFSEVVNSTGLFKMNTTFSEVVNSTGLFKMNTTEPKNVKNKEKFAMKMRIVFNKNDAQQKETIEKYLSNVENNLLNTKVDAEWIDKDDQNGQALIQKLDAKFLPLFLTDETVKKHPQYELFAPAINSVNGEMVFLSEGMEYLKTPEVGDAKYIGMDPKKAKLVITEYSSMTCGFCKMMHPVLENTVKKFPNVSVVIKHFDRGGIDTILAQAVECAEEQGKGKFALMTTKMFDRQSEFFTASSDEKDPQVAINNEIKLAAKEAGVNGDKVLACIKSEKYADLVKNSSLEGQSFGVMGTPSLFVGKKFLGGALGEEEFFKIVNEELAKK